MAYTREKWTKEQQVYTRIHNSIFESGLVTVLGRGRVMTLLAIASHMKENGKAWPTQERLARMTGVSVRTIRDDINFMKEFKIEGTPLIKSIRYTTLSGHKSYVYKIMPVAQISKFKEGKLEHIPKLIEDETEVEIDNLANALDELDE